MNVSGNTILLTGGASGIGLALATRFLKRGNKVIICGRREEKLAEVKAQFPHMHTRICDIEHSAEREALVRWVIEQFPDLSVLVNNAGIQRRVDLTKRENWKATLSEIKIN